MHFKSEFDSVALRTLNSLDKGAFNNYVDKKRGRGGQPKVQKSR